MDAKAGEWLSKFIATMSRNPVRNYGLPGLTSSLVGGGDRGLVRVFKSSIETREFLTPHSHRFDFMCLVAEGWVENVLFRTCSSVTPGAQKYAVTSITPIAGGLGEYDREAVRQYYYLEHKARYEAGQIYSMISSDIHTIRFSKGATVLFFEGPEKSPESYVLEPVDGDGKVVPTFRTQPWMFRREAA